MKILIILLLSVTLCFGQKKAVYHTMEGAYITLNALDLVTTYKVLEKGGYEANPFMAKVIENRPLAIGAKILTTGIFLGSCRFIKKDNPKLAFALLLAGNIGYGFLVNHNYQLSVRLKI